MTKQKYKVTVQYDGTDYSGWQVQPKSPSIQETLQEALSIPLQQKIRVQGSGRTDAGVHAMGQVGHFSCEETLDPTTLLRALNGLLPGDIRALSLEEVPSSFHAQKSAVAKTYHYHVWLDSVASPFNSRFRHHVRNPLELELLKTAAELFVGTHDFTSFANSPSEGAASINPIRKLYRLDLKDQEGGFRLEFEGNGFLYKMVRNIVATLLEVATGKLDVSSIPDIFAAKDRKKACGVAPARGLFLMEVRYD